MNSHDFDKCRSFLEKHLEGNIDNTELLQAYLKLIELKSKYDLETDKAYIEKQIKEAELNTQYNTAVHTNNTDFNKSVHQNNTAMWTAQSGHAAATQQHYQGQHYGTLNNAIGQGLLQNPSNF